MLKTFFAPVVISMGLLSMAGTANAAPPCRGPVASAPVTYQATPVSQASRTVRSYSYEPVRTVRSYSYEPATVPQTRSYRTNASGRSGFNPVHDAGWKIRGGY